MDCRCSQTCNGKLGYGYLQMALLPISRHSENCPHGDGTQGFEEMLWSGGADAKQTIGEQRMKASPVYPKRQLHMGEWLRVSHSAFAPHESLAVLIWITNKF
ncbi:hypothetical protein GQX74_002301 [Glossina fuscipes]|nr:hypothetical protein GQX74_002301 [Glossina fuscipes]